MQSKRSQKFDFDFNRVYKKIITTTNKIATNRANGNINTTKYYYLGREDILQDVFELTFKYLRTTENVTEDHFLSMFWSNWKIVRMQSFDKKNPRTKEYKNFVRPPDDPEYALYDLGRDTTQPDLDLAQLTKVVDKSYPAVKKIISGYTFREAGKEAGISGRGYQKRYVKELEQLKNSNVYR